MRSTVLVVTDDHPLHEGVALAFPSHVDVVVVSDAREAWARMQHLTPSVAVVDILTGSAGGFALARDMSHEARLSHVPVLMLIDRDQDAWLAREAGASRWRRKPLDFGELVAETLDLLPADAK